MGEFSKLFTDNNIWNSHLQRHWRISIDPDKSVDGQIKGPSFLVSVHGCSGGPGASRGASRNRYLSISLKGCEYLTVPPCRRCVIYVVPTSLLVASSWSL